MSTTPQPPPGTYSLFPNPNSATTPRRPASRTRRSESRERSRTRAPTPGMSTEASATYQASDASTNRHERQTPQHRQKPSLDSSWSQPDTHQSPLDARQAPIPLHEETPVTVQIPAPVADVPPRTDTAFSESRTLVRANSNRSRSSIAKLPITDEPSSSDGHVVHEAQVRSIFPQYNPEVPLGQQDYFPTQTSPTRIPRAIISRTSFHPGDENNPQSPDLGSPLRSPNYHTQPPQLQQQQQQTQAQRWPPRAQEMAPLPTESSTEQLKNLWKVVNGWRASTSDGRVYCMKLSQEKDSPVYTLSSKQQPFYTFRLDPTSASANVSLSRYDPNKPYKPASVSTSSSASSILSNVVGNKDSGKNAESKHWQEVLSTTIEEESRRHRPNDGLVALLYPAAAAKIVMDHPEDAVAINTAETECARLVWDDDSASHFLVHPALATPFCITIERNPAWSRVEYTLEHHESPQHLAKVTRDGTGRGWLQVDTAIAAKIESFFIVDVAVAALLLVVSQDERALQVETFEPPPLPSTLDAARADKRLSFLGGTGGGANDKSKKSSSTKGSKRNMEVFEVDVESQDGNGFAEFKQSTREARRKLPWPFRFTFKIVGGCFKCFIWCATIMFKAIAAVVMALLRCTGLASRGG